MKEYRNEGGKSGVAGYELGEDSITVQFTSGTRYLYTVDSCGREALDTMKKLTEAGIPSSAAREICLQDGGLNLQGGQESAEGIKRIIGAE